MAKIAVFDSGLGSLSIIRAIQGVSGPDIVYLADQASYPYGTKSPARLGRIIRGTIGVLRERFDPDLIVVASNTPSLVLDIGSEGVIGVLPPLGDAAARSRAGRVGVLATESAISSGALSRHIRRHRPPGGCKFFQIDASALVDLVESGKFVTDRGLCATAIDETLGRCLPARGIDAVTLSSTHLSFLRPLLEERLPRVRLVDPAAAVAARVAALAGGRSGSGSLRIFATGDLEAFRAKLAGIGVRDRVSPL